MSSAHAAGVATRDAGTGLTLTAPLRWAHADGSPVMTPGTGVTLATPLRENHASGEAMTSNGITLTPALSQPHTNGTSVGEMGLEEPPLDTPLPAYWGFVLAHKLAQPGAAISELASPSETLLAFSSIHAGRISVLLINTDDSAPAPVSLEGLFDSDPHSRFGPTRQRISLQTFSYGLETPSLVEGTTTLKPGRGNITLPPESLMVLVAEFQGSPPQPRLTMSR